MRGTPTSRCLEPLRAFTLQRTVSASPAKQIFLRLMRIVEDNGSGFALPSQTLYLSRDRGLDEQRRGDAEQRARRWRGRGEVL